MESTTALQSNQTLQSNPQNQSNPQTQQNQSLQQNIKDYYQQITSQDIGQIARELLSITTEKSNILYCNCPKHESQTRISFQVDTTKQNWYCFGFGIGGDILHLVEFAQSGTVTKKVSGKMTDTHIQARDFLAARIGLPVLSSYGLTTEQLQELERTRLYESRVKECFTEIAIYYHEKLLETKNIPADDSPHHLLKKKWGLSDDIIHRLKIGYAPVESSSQNIFTYLEKKGFDIVEIAGTGVFTMDKDENLYPFFKNRLTFPYWSNGAVVYMIGRQTPWTEDQPWEKGKYKKSLTHNPHEHIHVAPFISNSVLYNEDILLTKPSRVIITEGVTDCISLIEHDFPTISPVTVNIKDKDWDRILTRLCGTDSVYLCLDNELSQAGFQGAYRASHRLREANKKAFIVTLPLREKQIEARRKLSEIFSLDFSLISDVFMPSSTSSSGSSISTSVQSTQLTKTFLLTNKTEEEKKVIQELLQDAKIDLNEWFNTGGTTDEFEELLIKAKTVLDFGIESIPVFTPPENDPHQSPDINFTSKQNQLLMQVLTEVASLPLIEQDPYIKKIYEHLNKEFPKTTLKNQIKEISKTLKKEAKEQQSEAARKQKIETLSAAYGITPSQLQRQLQDPQNSFISTLIPTQNLSCKAAIELHLANYELNRNPSYKSSLDTQLVEAAKIAISWFEEHGATFYYSKNYGSFMAYNSQIIYFSTSDRQKKDIFVSFMLKETGMTTTTQGGRTFFEVFKSLAIEKAHPIDEITWTYTNFAKTAIYFSLNNPQNQIIKISPNNTDIMPNGNNPDRIILSVSNKLKPIEYNDQVNITEADKLFDSLITDNLTCSPGEKLAIKLWVCCFLLLGFAQSRAIMRFEGSQGSGKSSASDFISYLIFGQDWKKNPTAASNYADATQNPFIIIDNVETKNLTQSFADFMLTAATGIVREKRRPGTDSDVITERANCLININGIEPLSGSAASELLTRTIVCNFDESRFKPAFIKEEAIQQIKIHRNTILSGIIKKTSIILQAISEKRQLIFLNLIQDRLGKHHKSRCNGYLSLMLMYYLIGANEADFNQKADEFLQAIGLVNTNTLEIAKETNCISTALHQFFTVWNNTERLDNDFAFGGDSGSRRKFLESYNLRIVNNTIHKTKAIDLFSNLKRFTKDRCLEFPYTNVKQFAYRLNNDLEVIQDAGFVIESSVDRKGIKDYTITYKPSQENYFLNSCNSQNNNVINFESFKQIRNLNDISQLGGMN